MLHLVMVGCGVGTDTPQDMLDVVGVDGGLLILVGCEDENMFIWRDLGKRWVE